MPNKTIVQLKCADCGGYYLYWALGRTHCECSRKDLGKIMGLIEKQIQKASE